MYNVFMRYPEGVAKAVTFSYDDGVPDDRRLAEIFTRHGMKCTFNMNSDSMRKVNFTPGELHECFLDCGHEIAVHGAHHRANGLLRTVEGIREVLDCRLELEKKCDRIIRGMAYPNSGIRKLIPGTTYDGIKQYLTELGIVYARTLGGDNNDFMLPTDFHAWMPSAHHRNPKLNEYVDEFIALDYSSCYRASKWPRLLYVWGHSFEFERDNNWELIEGVCDKLAAADGIWYATNIEIYEYVEAYGRLVYSADGYTVYNPTLIKLWFEVDGVTYSVAPGETLRIAES